MKERPETGFVPGSEVVRVLTPQACALDHTARWSSIDTLSSVMRQSEATTLMSAKRRVFASLARHLATKHGPDDARQVVGRFRDTAEEFGDVDAAIVWSAVLDEIRTHVEIHDGSTRWPADEAPRARHGHTLGASEEGADAAEAWRRSLAAPRSHRPWPCRGFDE